ncbi:MAG: hypothetical protein OES18_13110 [Deltaproteobacteria bacterium]|nr:hypothetical protein [Deltaproteobacteria bacterium]
MVNFTVAMEEYIDTKLILKRKKVKMASDRILYIPIIGQLL